MTAGKIRRNWLAWALVASLCVNLAVVGLVIGAALHGKPDRPPPGGEWAMARDLPEPYRENMIAQLRAGRDKWIGPRERIGAQRSALADALDAEPFDIDRVRGILEAGRRSLDELAEHGARLLAEQIAEMPPDDRATYAKALRRSPHDKREHGKRDRD
ncbi:MAG: periplasmic heavy metal sensor [Rhodobacteraceae bacterium]|nr:periplasmic heavy metal sensor [Paracoccaceae bacterium]